MSRNAIITIHVIFWLFFIFFGVLINVATHNNLKISWALYEANLLDPFTWIGYSRTITTCYFSLWIFNYLFRHNRYLLASASLVLLIFFDISLRYIIEQVLIGPVFNIWQFPKTIALKAYFIENVFFSSLGIFICFFLKIINDYFINEKIKQEKNSMELQFLKSQINPHFLFNSFNNLYALSLTEPHKAPDVILKLAALTRYMIYESNEDKVLLSKEITYLQNLIDLQKLRYEEDIYLDINLDQPDEGHRIAPLLLISFVENAFKHGDLHNVNWPVTIKISVVDSILHFRTSNKIGQQNKDRTGGVGLKNVIRRLDLLYKDRNKLVIKTDDNSYIVELQLNLD